MKNPDDALEVITAAAVVTRAVARSIAHSRHWCAHAAARPAVSSGGPRVDRRDGGSGRAAGPDGRALLLT